LLHRSDPRERILQRAVPKLASRSRRPPLDEPIRQCLGQCSEGELLHPR
jgi:hypothetical protein